MKCVRVANVLLTEFENQGCFSAGGQTPAFLFPLINTNKINIHVCLAIVA